MMPPRHVPVGQKTAEQRRAAYNRTRGSAASQGYDGAWRKLRAVFLARNPACVWCGKAANEVDHIVPLKADPSRRLDWANLRAACSSCHSRHGAKTRLA
jgi:5-methylcytosine-specific restriction protein A